MRSTLTIRPPLQHSRKPQTMTACFLTQKSGMWTRSLGNMADVRVLVVEDERKLAQVLTAALEGEHYDVVVAATGEDGFFRASAETFDLVILDLMLPGRSGLEILQAL